MLHSVQVTLPSLQRNQGARAWSQQKSDVSNLFIHTMENSLQDYRCKIGSFLNNRGRGKYKSCSQKCGKRKMRTFKCSPVFLLMFSLICIFTSSLGQNILQQRSQSNNLQNSNYRNCSDGWKPSSMETIDTNFESRYKYGNKQKNGIKIMHWNAGGKHLVNKIENIESVINGYKPADHIFNLKIWHFII